MPNVDPDHRDRSVLAAARRRWPTTRPPIDPSDQSVLLPGPGRRVIIDNVGWGTTPTLRRNRGDRQLRQHQPDAASSGWTLTYNAADFSRPPPPPAAQDPGGPVPPATGQPRPQTGTGASPIPTLQLAATGGTPPTPRSDRPAAGPEHQHRQRPRSPARPTTAVGSPFAVTLTVTDSAGAGRRTPELHTGPSTRLPPASRRSRTSRAPAPARRINGQVVSTEGVVTASYPTGGFNGFYIQTPGADTAERVRRDLRLRRCGRLRVATRRSVTRST